MEQSAPTPSYTQFCILSVDTTMFNCKIDGDLGTDADMLNNYGLEISKKSILVRKMNSAVDALNYMASIGWEFVESLSTKATGGTTSTEKKYLMKRTNYR